MNIFNRNRILGIFITLFSFTMLPNTSVQAQGQFVDYNMFYNELAPYGNWYNDPQYGYVWQPNVDPNFRPYYTNGHWAMTEYGNMWVSNYAWGWAAFHYGRWTLGNYGWVWIPGAEWAPAWVEWREAPGYYGWAPMAPGVSITMSLGGHYSTPSAWFTFVPYNNMYNMNFQYYRRPSNFTFIFNGSFVLNNSYRDNRYHYDYAYGPRRDQYQYHTNRPAPIYQVNDRYTPVSSGPRRGNNVSVYRPNVNNSGNSNGPSNVRNPNQAPNNTTNGVRVPNGANTNTSPNGTTTNSRVPNANGSTTAPSTNVRPSTPANNTNTGTRTPAANNGTIQNQPATNGPIRSTTPATTPSRSNAAPATTTPVRNTVPATTTPARNTAPTTTPARNAAPATTPARSAAPATNTPSRAVAPARTTAPAAARQATPASSSRSNTAPSTPSRVVR